MLETSLDVGSQYGHGQIGIVIERGLDRMQQCRERDVDPLYLEEPLAPGATHRPMYDTEGNYPWHQYETITPSFFMVVEILPVDAA